MTGVMSGLAPGAIKYSPPVGGSAGVASQSIATTVMPPGPTLVAEGLVVEAAIAPGPEHFDQVKLLVNDVDTPLVCSLIDANTKCESPPGSSVEIPGGARIVMQVTAGLTSASTSVSWGFRLRPAG